MALRTSTADLLSTVIPNPSTENRACVNGTNAHTNVCDLSKQARSERSPRAGQNFTLGRGVATDIRAPNDGVLC